VTIGVWLLAVGACDLLRASRDTTSPRRRVLLVLVGCGLLAIAGAALRFPAGWWAWVGVVWAVTLVGWVVGSSLALQPGHHRRAMWRAVAFAALVVPVVVLGLLGTTLPAPVHVPAGWGSTVLGQVGPTRTVLVAGVLLFELSTANIVVRLLLDAIGVPASTNEENLRGGRLLGPMERVFILVLALGGELTAAAVVVAAKGLLRWPELRSQQAGGPTPVSEYLLIGSLASWLLGILGWLLTRV
jgi:hypothetical protein